MRSIVASILAAFILLALGTLVLVFGYLAVYLAFAFAAAVAATVINVLLPGAVNR